MAYKQAIWEKAGATLMAEELTESEVRAMIALWASRRDPASAGPTAADVAEALEISVSEAEALAREVNAGHPASNSGKTRSKNQAVRGVFAGRLALVSLGLTGLLCAYLDRLLA